MTQFKFAASLIICTSLLSSSAFAHISYKDEVAPKSVYNWTGFYAGLNAGAVQNTMNITDTEATTFYATIQQVSNPAFTGGFQLGYRRQLDLTQASGVYGIEFSADFANDTSNKEYGSSFALYQLSSKNELQDLCLLQLIGGIAADRSLLFMAAGMSWANISGNVTSLNGVPFFNSFNVGKKVLGAALGGGIEYAFTDKISARIKVDFIKPGIYTTKNNVDNSYQITNSITQGTFAINYKFA
ncbi:MAG: outer membrane beta-barrel protein [Gammaproteobacteria bacterium]|nr:outer membrane beta-barrel protein [Gammaproteobacteria bacterium]